MYRISNAPAPDELLLTAREALKPVLQDPDADHSYTIRMVMNAMGIASRAMGTGKPAPVRPDMTDADLKAWLREADWERLTDPGLIRNLRSHVDEKLAISNPRFQTEY